MKEIKPYELALSFAGCFLGAGFVSGQELWQFFGSFGPYGFIGLAVSVVCLITIGILLISLAKKTGISRMDNIIIRFNNKYLRAAVGLLQSVFLFGIVTVMVAGAGALTKQLFGIPSWCASLVMCAAVCAVAIKGIGGVVKAFSVCVPLIVTATIGFAVAAIFFFGADSIDFSPAESSNGLLPTWYISAFAYAAYNIFSSIGILTPFGSAMKSSRVIRLSVIAGGLLLTLVALSVMLATCLNRGSVSSELPMLETACAMNRPLGIIYGILLLFGMFGTSLSSLVALTNYLRIKFTVFTRRSTALTIGTGVLVFPASLFGFGTLVSTVYPMFGYICAVMMIFLAEHCINVNRKNKVKNENKQ